MNIPWSLNMPRFWIWQGYTKFWIYVSMLLKKAWICQNMPETKLKIAYKLSSVYKLRYIHRCIENPAKHLSWSKKEPLAKIIIAWNYFPKILHYVWQPSKHRWTFKYVRVLNMPRVEKALNICEYALEQCLNMLEYAWNRT